VFAWRVEVYVDLSQGDRRLDGDKVWVFVRQLFFHYVCQSALALYAAVHV
jgi:hypothetical protein